MDAILASGLTVGGVDNPLARCSSGVFCMFRIPPQQLMPFMAVEGCGKCKTKKSQLLPGAKE